MEYIKIAGLPLDVSRIGLGTWAISGWMWSGTGEDDAISTGSVTAWWCSLMARSAALLLTGKITAKTEFKGDDLRSRSEIPAAEARTLS